jgi:hypothetical protein
MIIARIEQAIFERLVALGERVEDASILASHIRSAATCLCKYGPVSGPRADEYLDVWLGVISAGTPPAEAWRKYMEVHRPAPPPPGGDAGQGAG